MYFISLPSVANTNGGFSAAPPCFFVFVFVFFNILRFLLKYACIKQITLSGTNSLGLEHMHILNSNSEDFPDLIHINDDYFTSTDYFH